MSRGGKSAFDHPAFRKGARGVLALCKECGELAKVGPINCPLDGAVNNARAKGWDAEGHGKWALCPTCRAAARRKIGPRADARSEAPNPWDVGMPGTDCPAQPKPQECEMSLPLITKPAAPATLHGGHPAVEKASPNSLKAMRRLYALLEENFDAERGAWRSDSSDQRLAADTGLSVETVVRVRREAYGELKNPELQKLAADIESVAGLLRELQQRLEKLKIGAAR